MMVHILYDLKDGPWGGGNQFLKALRRKFISRNIYTEEPEKADCLLINSHHFGDKGRFLNKLWKIKKNKPHVAIIHRIDGPITSVRGSDIAIDKLIFTFNHHFVDGTIYQSEWSHQQTQRLLLDSGKSSTVIHNSTDLALFNEERQFVNGGGKCRLIATSWSSNWKKGFRLYQYLDDALDFSDYQMTFVGNSPIKFKNIQHIDPVSSDQLAKILKQHDVYITASEDDPCSNSLIEALSCGLPAVAKNSGGHPELVAAGGSLFAGTSDVIEKIDEVKNNITQFQNKITVQDIDEAASRYIDFMEEIQSAVIRRGEYASISYRDVMRVRLMMLRNKIGNLFQRTEKKQVK